MKTAIAALLVGTCLSAPGIVTVSYAQAAGDAQGASGAAASGAQASVDPNDAGETIIVTARRRNEALQDVPLVVNAVSQEQVQKLNLRSLNDVQALVPGLSLSNQANGTGGNATLRGVNFDVNASGNNPTVEFYYNDAPISSGVLLQSLFDVGQIEVLRGPQGTLRGRASPSGSILVTTRRPSLTEIGGNLNMSGNDIGTINFNGGFGVPIIEDRLAVRVAGVIEESDYDRVKTINGAVDRRDPFSRTLGGRVTVRAQPFDALSLEGSYQKMQRDTRGYDQVASLSEVVPGAPASPVFIGVGDREGVLSSPRINKQIYTIYNGQAQLALAGQRLVYVFQHNSQDVRAFTPQDLAVVFPTRTFGQSNRTDPTSTSHELRLQNDDRVFGLLDYVVGALDLKNTNVTNLIQQTPIARLGSIVSIVNTPVLRVANSHERSVFGNLTAHPTDRIELSGGARYISYKANGSLKVNTAAAIADPRIDDDHVIYTASAKYSISPSVIVYANTGSSYRPAITAIGDNSLQKSALEQSFINLPPETSRSYEVGFKSTLFDRELRLNVSAYHQDFKNYPYRAPNRGVYYVAYAGTVSGGTTLITPTVTQFNFVGAVPVRVNGVEAEVAFSGIRNLDIGLVASYSLGKIKNGQVPCNDLNGDGIPDALTVAPTLAQLQAAVGGNNISACRVTQRSSFSPPFSATLQSEYRYPLSGKVDSYLRGLFTYYNRSQADPTIAYDDVGSYGLLNLYTGVRDPEGQWEIALFAKNVFNVEKALSRSTPLSTSYQALQAPTFRTTAAVSATSTYTNVTATPPREFGISFRYNFGSR